MTAATDVLAHARDVRAAFRAVPDRPAPAGALGVPLAQVLAFRARATRLDRRLPAGSYREAARGGLQDSAPRAALAALHARVEGVVPASWEDPVLVQVWFRCADYVVPEADLGVFTLGALPWDPLRASALAGFAGAVAGVLADEPRGKREVMAALPAALARGGHPPALASGWLLRAACVAARYRIRWDARTVVVIPAEPPEIDPGEARLELARRFLGWHGPASTDQFAKWAGVSRADAHRTWALLAPELVPVAVDGRARHLLERDVESLTGAEPPDGVRFLPDGDPFRAVDRALFDRQPGGPRRPTRDEHGAPVTRRLVNSLSGRILVDGMILGAWGRAQERMAIHLWDAGGAQRDRIAAEAERFAGPIGRPIRVRWLE